MSDRDWNCLRATTLANHMAFTLDIGHSLLLMQFSLTIRKRSRGTVSRSGGNSFEILSVTLESRFRG